MFRIPRPQEPGVYDLNLFEGETIEGITFSNMDDECFNIHLSSGRVFVVCVHEGALAAVVIDANIPKNHRGH